MRGCKRDEGCEGMETVITYGWTATYLGAGWSYTIYIYIVCTWCVSYI